MLKKIMKKKLSSAITALLHKSKFFRNTLFSIVLKHLKNNKSDFDYFIKEYLVKYPDELERYPSVFNEGHLHIIKTVEMAKFFKLDPTNIIVDVGGAAGEMANIFSGSFPEAKIYSFEPLPSTYKLLLENTRHNSMIIAQNKGLGSVAKTDEIHVAHRFTSSSLFEMKKEIENPFFAEHLKEKGTESVEISTLDKEIPSDKKVNILKLDVQGYELEVLKGGTETLKRTAIVLVEMQNHDLYSEAPKYYDIDSFLVGAGFELYNIIPSLRQDKKLYEWDGLYINKKNLK
jgi:FkbM family methyltransferase